MRSGALVLLAAAALGACTQLIDAPDATYLAHDPTLVPNESLYQLTGAMMDDNFGTEVVIEGDELIVAAANATLVDTLSSAEGSCGALIDAPGAGRVVIFEHGDDGWIQTDELRRTGVKAGEGTAHATAGRDLPRISLARAGDTVVMGVPAADVTACYGADEAVKQAGKVHVFRRANGRWEAEAILTASPPLPDGFFGAAVALRDDELFVGSNGADGRGDAPSGDATPRNNGVVYVFAREGGSWRETQRIVPSNAIDEAQFGNALSVQGDTLAVGAWSDAHPERGIHSSSEIPGDAGGSGEPVDSSGAAYVFRKRGGVWEQETYFKAFNPAAVALFGTIVALDGDFLFVGAPGESGVHGTANAAEVASGVIEADLTIAAAAGAVYAYQRGEQGWTTAAYLKATEPSAGSLFGTSLAAHSGRVLIGAPWESPSDANGLATTRAGAAYLYRHDGRSFALVATVHHPMLARSLNVGYSTGLSDRYAVIGAAADDVGPGSVSIFELKP